MGRIRATKHAANRYNERIGGNEKTKQVARLAYKNGKTAKHFKGALREYLLEKSSNGARARIVVYRGSVFVFNRRDDDDRVFLITTYKLPDELLSDYLSQMQIKNECRENKYKKVLFCVRENGLTGETFNKLKEACTKAHKYDQIVKTIKEGGIKELYEQEELRIQSEKTLS